MELKKVAIVTHTYTWKSLVEEELKDYLCKKAEKLTFVVHPFKQARDNYPLKTKVKIYSKGKLTRSFESVQSFGPEILFFVKDLVFNIIYFLFGKKINLFFGVNNLNAFSGIILKRLGKVDKVIYYVIDYVPRRFKNPVLNKIYHWTDFYCVKNADQTWNLAENMADERTRAGLDKKYLRKQIVVPVGCHPFFYKHDQNKHKIVFLGNLSQDQGVNLLIESMPKIKEKLPSASLTIIGSGEEMENLKRKSRQLNIEDSVEFRGFIKDNKEVNRILGDSSIGVAPYLLTEASFKYYTDPGKIKTYLGSSLPIIMTKISHIAGIIKKRKAGLVVNDNSGDIADAIIEVLTNRDLYETMLRNASILSKEYSWPNIFDKAFASLKFI